jgi:hypothetical protein
MMVRLTSRPSFKRLLRWENGTNNETTHSWDPQCILRAYYLHIYTVLAPIESLQSYSRSGILEVSSFLLKHP